MPGRHADHGGCWVYLRVQHAAVLEGGSTQYDCRRHQRDPEECHRHGPGAWPAPADQRAIGNREKNLRSRLFEKEASGKKVGAGFMPACSESQSSGVDKPRPYTRMFLRGDKPEEIEKRYKEDEHWEKDAENSKIPYIFINNEGRLEQTLEELSQYL